MKHRSSHSLWMRVRAAAVVCLFLVNTVAWAYPPTYVPSAKSTLATQSIFRPILDVAGTQYAARIEFEIASVISMALKGLKEDEIDYRSRLNINAALDKQCSDKMHGFNKRYRKLLEVVSNPILRDDDAIELHVRTTQYRKQREFRVMFRGDKVEDMLDRRKIEIVSTAEIEEKKPSPPERQESYQISDINKPGLLVQGLSQAEEDVRNNRLVDILRDGLKSWDELDPKYKLLKDGDEIFGKSGILEEKHYDVIEDDNILAFTSDKGPDGTEYLNLADPYWTKKPRIKTINVEKGYRPKHEVPGGRLTIIETSHPYRLYMTKLSICSGLVLKGKKEGKDVLILGHLLPGQIELLDKMIGLIQDLGIADIHGMLFTKSYSETYSKFREKVEKINKDRKLDLKVREIETTFTLSTDILITRGGILAVDYAIKDISQIKKLAYKPKGRFKYKPKNLEMYLWRDLTPDFNLDENPINLLDVLGKEKSLLKYNTKRSVPIDVVLARLAPVPSEGTTQFIKRFVEAYSVKYDELPYMTYEDLDTEITLLAKEAIIANEMAKRFSVDIKKPVFVVGLANTGTPYTWAMEDPLGELSEAEKEEFRNEVQTEKRGLIGIPHNDEMALFIVAERWIEEERLKWFTRCINYRISSKSTEGPVTTKHFFEEYERLFTGLKPALLFLDVSYWNRMPKSFDHITKKMLEHNYSASPNKYCWRNVVHRQVYEGDDNDSDIYEVTEPFIISSQFMSRFKEEALKTGEEIPCLFFSPGRLIWDGEERPFGKAAWHDDELRYGIILNGTMQVLDDYDIFERIIRERVTIVRKSNWDPQVFKPAPVPTREREKAHKRLHELVKLSKESWPIMYHLRRKKAEPVSSLLDTFSKKYDLYDVDVQIGLKPEDIKESHVRLGNKDGSLFVSVDENVLVVTENIQSDVLFSKECEKCTGCAFRGRKSDGTYIHGLFHVFPLRDEKMYRKGNIEYTAEKIKSYGVDRIECAFTEYQKKEIDYLREIFKDKGVEILISYDLCTNERSGVYLTADGTILGLTEPAEDYTIAEPPQITVWRGDVTEPELEGERPALESHQKDVTDKVKKMLRKRLQGSPLANQIFNFIEKKNVLFIKGKPKNVPASVPAEYLKKPAFTFVGYKAKEKNKEEYVEGIEWVNIYIDFEHIKKNYRTFIHELVEIMFCLKLVQTEGIKFDSLQKLTDKVYTDAMTNMLVAYYSREFQLNYNEHLIALYDFIACLSSFLGESDKYDRVKELLSDSIFAKELDRYLIILSTYAGAAAMAREFFQRTDKDSTKTDQLPDEEGAIPKSIAEILATRDLGEILAKFDYDKTGGGLDENEQKATLWLADNSFRIVNRILAEKDSLEDIFPSLSVLQPLLEPSAAPEDIEMPETRNFLNRASRYLEDYPVDMVIDLSLIPKEDIVANMKTWAYLVLLHNRHKLDVNYIFKSKDDKEYEQDTIQLLMTKIMELASLYHLTIDIDEITRHINKPHADSRTLEVHIMKLEDLKKIKTLSNNVLPVAMSEGDTQYGVPVRDFVSAANIGLAQAACKKMMLEKNPNLVEVVEREILPRLQEIYKRLFSNENIKDIVTKETVFNMIDDNPIVRRNLAIALALPPIVRVAIDQLRNYHERIHDLLKSA